MRRVLALSAATLVMCVVARPFQGRIGGAESPTPQGTPISFTRDVAPILHGKCVTCHRAGEVAPMPLLTYDDARPWARSIKAKVAARQMPPWFADPSVGAFANDARLSDAEIATITKWVDAGAPQGNPADMPPMPKSEDITTWRIGQPDLVVRYPEFKMPAAGPDLYGTLTAPFGLTDDRYIKAIQSRVVDSDSRKVVHHALSFAVVPGDDGPTGDDSGGGSGQFLVEYASGKNATFYDDDAGVLLKAGQDARVEYHFHSVGEAVNVHIELGLVFYPKGYVPKHVQWSKQLGQEGAPDLDIPAGQVVRRDGYTRLNAAARLTAWQPHMHIRGKYQCLELIYPGEPVRTETVTCARWNYNWHTIYNYADDVAPIVPAGTLLHVISWYDNTPTNKYNPDPKNWVGAGTGRTIDEMGFSWIGWYDLSDSEYKAEIAARKAKLPSVPTGQQQQ